MTQPNPIPLTEAMRVPISLYPDDVSYIDAIDAETGARNRSATIRRILREHARATLRPWPDPDLLPAADPQPA